VAEGGVLDLLEDSEQFSVNIGWVRLVGVVRWGHGDFPPKQDEFDEGHARRAETVASFRPQPAYAGGEQGFGEGATSQCRHEELAGRVRRYLLHRKGSSTRELP